MKDKFTKAEIGEFIVGSILTVFLSFSAIDKLAGKVNIERGLFLFIISIGTSVGFLYLRKVEKLPFRLLSALVISLCVTFLYFPTIFGTPIIPTSTEAPLYLVSMGASTIGALTVDILRDDGSKK